MDPERCSSTSVQLVRLPSQPIAPGVSIERNTGDTLILKSIKDGEQTIESERCSSTSVQLVQLPTQPFAPGVSIEKNTGDTLIMKTIEGRKQTIESERCSSTSLQLVQLPTQPIAPGVSIERNTGNSEDLYRPMTPGDKEIMRIYEDGIYRATNMIERSGGLWITGRISPLLDPPILTPVEIIDSDPELDELLRDSPDLWESSTPPYPSILQEVRQEADQWRTAAQTTRIVVWADCGRYFAGGSRGHVTMVER